MDRDEISSLAKIVSLGRESHEGYDVIKQVELEIGKRAATHPYNLEHGFKGALIAAFRVVPKTDATRQERLLLEQGALFNALSRAGFGNVLDADPAGTLEYQEEAARNGLSFKSGMLTGDCQAAGRTVEAFVKAGIDPSVANEGVNPTAIEQDCEGVMGSVISALADKSLNLKGKDGQKAVRNFAATRHLLTEDSQEAILGAVLARHIFRPSFSTRQEEQLELPTDVRRRVWESKAGHFQPSGYKTMASHGGVVDGASAGYRLNDRINDAHGILNLLTLVGAALATGRFRGRSDLCARSPTGRKAGRLSSDIR